MTVNLAPNLADNINPACSDGNAPCDIMTLKSKKKKKSPLVKHILSSTNYWHVHTYTHTCVHTYTHHI